MLSNHSNSCPGEEDIDLGGVINISNKGYTQDQGPGAPNNGGNEGGGVQDTTIVAPFTNNMVTFFANGRYL